MSKSILLVDDDDSNRLVLSVLLEDEGFAVDPAPSFSAARAKLAEGGARYDVVLLDQHLGDGLGTDLVRSIRERLPGAKIIVISGSIGDGIGERAGADAVMAKGAAFPEVMALIERVGG
jgi:two-component system, response regulator RegA